jgi:hypothetical protein
MSYCCDDMKRHLTHKCEDHSKYECPDHLIDRWDDGTTGIIVHDGGSSLIVINYCPWCGKGITQGKSNGKCSREDAFSKLDVKVEKSHGLNPCAEIPISSLCEMSVPSFIDRTDGRKFFKSDHPCKKCGKVEVWVEEINDYPDYRITCDGCKHSYCVDGPDG